MRFIACVLLAVASAKPEADPALVYGGLPYAHGGYLGGYHGYPYALGLGAATYTYATPTVEAVASIGATPVAVGGYRAVAGDNGGLKGAVHEVPGLIGAPLLATQESAGDVSLTTGTGVYAIGHKLNTVTVPVVSHLGLGHVGLGKREAEAEPEAAADPYLLYGGYAGGYAGYGGLYGAGYGYSGLHYPTTYSTYGLGHGYGLGYGYYANSGGAVHAVGKREAEAEPEADPEADPYFYYGHGGYGGYYGGHGYGYGYGHRAYSGYYGHGYSYPTYGGYYGYGRGVYGYHG